MHLAMRIGAALVLRFSVSGLVLMTVASQAWAQPATPPLPHVEAVGTLDSASNTIGATPGDFRVDEGGAATYSVPIAALPGTAGLTPKLSIDYNARGATGALGTGFALGGQSAISRCKATLEAGDGAGPYAGVDFTPGTGEPFYCLDGQRLFRVFAPYDTVCPIVSVSASAQRPYRTELDPATRICGYSLKVGGEGENDFWLVFPKDGSMRRYGYAGNSALRPNDGAAAWPSGYTVQALDRIADASGNTVDFVYTGDALTGELLLSEARYTGRVANRLDMNAAFVRAPFARTEFLYDPMPFDSQRVDFFGGSRMALTKRLSTINLYGPLNNGANPMLEVRARTYRLTYRVEPTFPNNTGSRQSRLIALNECAPNPAGGADVCYPPTRFAWNSPGDNDFPQGYVAPATSQSYSNLINFAVDFKVGDINGDGRQDVVYIKDRNCSGNPDGERDPDPGSAFRFRFMVALGNEAGLTPSQNVNVFPRRTPPIGAPQIPSCENAGPATNFDANAPIRWDLIWHLFDLTGDGRDDLIASVPDIATCSTCYRAKVFAAVKVGGEWVFESAGTDLNLASNQDVDSNLIDLTGDGLPDLLIGRPPGLSARVMRRLTNGNFAYEFEPTSRQVNFSGFEADASLSFGTTERDSIRAGDLTGDGIADLLIYAEKVRSGIQCNNGVNCTACGGVSQPPCEAELLAQCPTGPGDCKPLETPPPIRTDQPRWQRAGQSRIEQNRSPEQIITEAKYWVTAKVTPVGDAFLISAGQCVGNGTNVAFCDHAPDLLSASLADLNADGLSDVLMRERFSGSGNDRIDQFAFRLNRGGNAPAGNLLPRDTPNFTLKRREADRAQLVDVTGDKRLDLVFQRECSSGCTSGANPLVFRRFTSGGFAFQDEAAATGSPAILGNQDPNQYLTLPLDINGDGAPELVRYRANNSSSNNLYVVVANLRFGGQDSIVQITNGLGARHTVQYAPLVNQFAYERAHDGPRLNFARGSAIFDVFSPLWVVRVARSSSPGCSPDASVACASADTAATGEIRYSYRGARVQTGGRGFLGFAAIRTEDFQNKLLTTTDYRQDYPYIGRPSRTLVEALTALTPDPCLNDPLGPQCFVEPPENCGPNICPVIDAADKSIRPYPFPRMQIAGKAATSGSMISDHQTLYTTVPPFVPTQRQPVFPYGFYATEKRFDLATGTPVHRVVTVTGAITENEGQIVLTRDGMDQFGNLLEQSTATFDQTNALVDQTIQLNYYGFTETPVQLIKTIGCAGYAQFPTHPRDPERTRLGRLSLAGVVSIRGGLSTARRTTFEYDPTTLLLIAEVSGLYDPTEYTAAERARLHQRTDHVLDANGNRTFSVTCSVADFPDRAACLNLSQFRQDQWRVTPTKFQRYARTEYDTLGRFVQGTKSPYFSSLIAAGVEAYNERIGVTQTGALNRNVFGDPLGALTAHGVFSEKFYGPLGREHFARSTTGAFGRTRYAWCADAGTAFLPIPTLPDGTGGIPIGAPRANCPAGAVYRIEGNSSESFQNIASIAPRTFAYFDILGRQILSTSRIYQNNGSETDSRWSSVYTRFDVLGRTRVASEPYFSVNPTAVQGAQRAGDSQSGASPAETRSAYDVLGRSTSVQIPSEFYNGGFAVQSAEFDRMQTINFNPRGFDTTIDKNGLAETKLARDDASFQVNYTRTTFGNLTQVSRTPNNGSSAGQAINTVLAFDALGRKSGISDPDKGLVGYTYNALGEVLSETDAKGQVRSYFYDALGRLVERRENRRVDSGGYVDEPTAQWFYDDGFLIGTSTKTVGLLLEESYVSFSRAYAYDSLARLTRLTTTLEGTSYTARTTYDQYGRVFQSFDPALSPSSPLGQLQVYSSDGFPIGVREAANGTTGILYNEVLALTARQQVRRERYHGSNALVSERTFDDNTGRLATIKTGLFSGGTSGTVNGDLQNWITRWDKNGNLILRHDQTAGADWQEEFEYDTLDRLQRVRQTRAAGAPTNVTTLDLQYDQLGNITHKSGPAGSPSNLGAYTYKSTPFQTGCTRIAGPHAVSQVAGKNYCYDENGNNTQVRKNGSPIRTITYTGFDLPERITRNEFTGDGTIQAEVSFKYGIDRSMYKRVDGNVGPSPACGVSDGIFCARFEDDDTPPPPAGTKTTFYIGNVEFIREGITDSVKRYIGGFLVITTVQANPPVYDYLLRDSLGSIDTIASETGALKSRQSFNAHGQRRNAATPGVGGSGSWALLTLLQSATFASTNSTTTQGFTGHEQLDAVGLTHMGARLYDAEIGRFIQADDFVEPEATQGLNRYSYVLNNPLTATDPTGNFSLRQAVGIVVGVVAAIISGQLFLANALLKSFLVAVAGGFASAAIATGSLKAGLWGAVSAAVFWGIGTHFSSVRTTFIQRGPGVEIVTSRVASGSSIAKVAAHAAAGGTLNRLQGGKFGHGFLAAGFTEALSPAVGQIGDGKSFGSILGRTAASAAIGGTVSDMTGGSFAAGASTAAFQQLFNHVAHPEFEEPSYWDSFDERAAEMFSGIAGLADNAVDYWVEQGGVAGAIGGTLAGTLSSNNIGHTIRQASLGAATGGAGRAANWLFQARGGAHAFFSGSLEARTLALGTERLGFASIYSTRFGAWANNLAGWQRSSAFIPASIGFAATTTRASVFLGSNVRANSYWNLFERPILFLVRPGGVTTRIHRVP